MGILEFVFGKSAPKDDTEPKQAYYLSDDDAKTFGNIEYMRSNKVVKRTFAKQKGQTEHMESVRQISATTATNLDGNNNGFAQPTPSFGSYAAPSPAPAAAAPSAAQCAPVEAPKTETSSTSEAAPAPRRKPASSDMDMFRNMAKDIRR
ncbi:MAG: hypothetical protein AAFZ17_22250 [Cyanobacteria bacterium J06650_10]